MSLAEAEKTPHGGYTPADRWNVKAAAQMLGIDRSTVYEKIKAYGIVKERKRQEPNSEEPPKL